MAEASKTEASKGWPEDTEPPADVEPPPEDEENPPVNSAETPAEGQAARDKVLRESYATATAELREKYLDEFNAIRVRICKAAGVEWSPKPSEEQLAVQQVIELFTKFPEVAKKFGQKFSDA